MPIEMKTLTINGVTYSLVDEAARTEAMTQSDWNQNDETASDHIKNKPFGEEVTVIVPETTYVQQDGIGGEVKDVTLTIGEIYTVVFDGVSYECECYSDGGFPTVGAPYGDFSEYPFNIYFDSSTSSVWYGARVDGEHTVSVIATNITKISGKFVKGMGWSDGVKKTVVDTVSVEFAAANSDVTNPFDIEFVDGNTYVVTWDGVEYECVAYIAEGPNTPSIGNGAIGGVNGGNYEPFFMTVFMGNVMVFAAEEGTHEISISAIVETIHQIDQKYLPNFAGKDITGKEFDIDGEIIVAGEHAEVFNDYENNIAIGINSHAEGESTTASGNQSHAEGFETTASGDFGSHAEGDGTTASGSSSHAEGRSTTASGTYSHAEGSSTTASGPYSHAEGDDTTASGNSSHAEGLESKAIGDRSHAEGQNTTASGIASHSEGYSTEASGPESHAEGYDTTASGDYSHAEGWTTTASGKTSHSEGWGTIASGDHSHVEGCFTTASSNYQHVQGKFNVDDAADAYVHIVGNGDAGALSNAHTLDWSGNAWFSGDVYVGSTSGTNKDEGSKKLATIADLEAAIGTAIGGSY